MNILISNDDGWNAAGIIALQEVASDFGKCTVVGPAEEQSGVSHQMTLFGSMKLTQQSPQIWSLEGTPADCVRIGLTQLKQSFDLVLSGINNGANLGSDVYVSGTVAAAREAALFGLPSIAISQHRLRYNEAFDWTHTKKLAAQSIQHCIDSGLKNRELININLPDVSDSPTLPACQTVDPSPLDPAPRVAVFEVESGHDGTLFRSVGKYNDRARAAGHDVESCFAKKITMTRMHY